MYVCCMYVRLCVVCMWCVCAVAVQVVAVAACALAVRPASSKSRGALADIRRFVSGQTLLGRGRERFLSRV